MPTAVVEAPIKVSEMPPAVHPLDASTPAATRKRRTTPFTDDELQGFVTAFYQLPTPDWHEVRPILTLDWKRKVKQARSHKQGKK